MIWLWRDKPDAANMADHAQATFWYVLPSHPLAAAARGSVLGALGARCAITVALYLAMTWLAPRVGLRL